jgi:hypothetical protein
MANPQAPKETYLACDGVQPITRMEVERRRSFYHQALTAVSLKGQELVSPHIMGPEAVAATLVPLRDQSELHRVFFEAARDIHDEQERRAAADDAARIAQTNVTIADAQLKAAEAQASAAASQAKTAQDGIKLAELSAQAAQTQADTSERLVALADAQSKAASQSVAVARWVGLVLLLQTVVFGAQVYFLREQVRLMAPPACPPPATQIHETQGTAPSPPTSTPS